MFHFPPRQIVLVQLAAATLVNLMTVIYSLHIWSQTDTLLLFHLFFHAFNHMQARTRTGLFCFACIFCFACLLKYLIPTSCRGMKLKCGTARVLFPHFHANQQLFPSFPSCWAPKMAWGPPTWKTPPGTTRASSEKQRNIYIQCGPSEENYVAIM